MPTIGFRWAPMAPLSGFSGGHWGPLCPVPDPSANTASTRLPLLFARQLLNGLAEMCLSLAEVCRLGGLAEVWLAFI